MNRIESNLIINAKEAGDTLSELRLQAKNLRRDLDTLVPGTANFVKKSEELKEVNGRLTDVKKGVKETEDSMKKFATGAVSSYALIKAITGDATNSQKAMEQAVRALAIAQSAHAVIEGLEASKSAITIGYQKTKLFFTNALTVAQQGLNAVMRANPFALVITAVTLLIGGLVALYANFKPVKDIIDAMFAPVKNISIAIGEFFGIIEKNADKIEANTKKIEANTKAYEQQIELLKARGVMQDEIIAKQREALNEEERLINKNISLQEKATAEQKKRLGEIKFEKEKLVEEEQKFNEDATKKAEEEEKKRQEKLKAVRDKAADEKKKKEEELHKAEIDADHALAELKAALIKDEFDRKIAEKTAQTEKEITNLKGSEQQKAEQETLLKEKLTNEIAQIEQERSKTNSEKLLEKELQQIENNETAKANKIQEKFLEQSEAETETLEEKFSNLMEAEQERDNALFELKQQGIQQRIDLLILGNEQEKAEAIKLQAEKLKGQELHNKKILDNEKKTSDLRKKIGSETYSNAKDILELGIELMDKDSKARRHFANALKAMQIAEIIWNAQKEISSIWQSVSSTYPYPFNLVVGGIGTGVVVARSALSIAKINKQEYSGGGFTGKGIATDKKGKKVSQINVFHENEWVSPEWMLKHPTYAPVIHDLERVRLKGYEQGGFTSPSATSAPSAVNTSPPASVIDNSTMSIAVLNEIKGLREDVRNQQKQIQAVISFQQLNEAIDTDAQVREDSSI